MGGLDLNYHKLLPSCCKLLCMQCKWQYIWKWLLLMTRLRMNSDFCYSISILMCIVIQHKWSIHIRLICNLYYSEFYHSLMGIEMWYIRKYLKSEWRHRYTMTVNQQTTIKRVYILEKNPRLCNSEKCFQILTFWSQRVAVIKTFLFRSKVNNQKVLKILTKYLFNFLNFQTF